MRNTTPLARRRSDPRPEFPRDPSHRHCDDRFRRRSPRRRIHRPPATPLVAVGQASIDLTPEWLKTFAIETFGENEKFVLFLGMAGELADSGESLTVNGSASVVGSDIHTDNATVYIIDEVLHP